MGARRSAQSERGGEVEEEVREHEDQEGWELKGQHGLLVRREERESNDGVSRSVRVRKGCRLLRWLSDIGRNDTTPGKLAEKVTVSGTSVFLCSRILIFDVYVTRSVHETDFLTKTPVLHLDFVGFIRQWTRVVISCLTSIVG